MSTEIKVGLGNPLLIFIYALALLLLGCAIGMHWHQSHATAIWVAVCGAVLVVINEMISGFCWVSLTAWWIHKNQLPGGMIKRLDESRCVGQGSKRR